MNKILESIADAGASKRTDDSRCNGVPESERIADRDDEVADSHLCRITYRHVGQAVSIYFQHGNVCFCVGADDFRFQ